MKLIDKDGGSKMEKKEEYVVYAQKTSYYGCILIAIGLGIACYWMFSLDAGDSLFEHRNVFSIRIISLLGMGMCLFSIIVLLKCVYNLRKDNRIIILTEEAIWLNHLWGAFKGWIGWEEIVNLEINVDQSENTVLEIYFKDKNNHFKKHRKNGLMSMKDIEKNIHHAGLAIMKTDKEPQEVAEKIFEYWENYKQQTGQVTETKKEEKTAYEMIEKPQTEEIEKTETGLKEGVLKAASFKKQEELKKIIEIRRKGETFFEFMIHPLEQKEVEGITSQSDLCKIYLATVDREKIWDNAEIQRELESQGYTISSGMDVIGAVLEESEIKEINVQIDKISGFYDSEILKVN